MRTASKRRGLSLAGVALVVIGCTGTPGPSATAPAFEPSASPSANVSPTLSQAEWDEDLDVLDSTIRHTHVAPFAIHAESEWAARLAEVRASIAAASPNEQITMVGSLVGLLDTHSSFVTIRGGWHWYGLLPYRFSDGWFIVNARDHDLVGARLESVAGVPIESVVERVTPFVPHDNANGLLEGLAWTLNSVESLNGAGIVADPDHPAYRLEQPDGTKVVVDPPAIGESEYDLFNPGWLVAPDAGGPEAVVRRRELLWSRLDEQRRVYLIAINDYGNMSAASAALTALFDNDRVDRVVLDLRYLQGGSGGIAILETLRDDPRINQTGALTALIGRENVSAATEVDLFLDTETEALLVGEATPARAGNFTCDCPDVMLPNSGFVISVPTYWNTRDDPRPEVEPDVPMALSSVDFFAGRDPVLDAALSGEFPASTP